MQRRTFVSALIATAAAGTNAQETYPNRPVTVLIGYTAGGLTDVMTRTLCERMGRELGQNMLVDNKAGAATSIASAAVAQARPDGYTLLMGTTTLAINPTLQPNLAPKQPAVELVPVGTAYYTPFALLVRKDLPAQTLAEFVAYAKANPGKVTVASSGVGSVNHLLLEMFSRRAGVKMVHVPYKGATPALIDLRGGRVDATFATPLDAMPVARDGGGRLLAVTSAEPLPLSADTPTVAQSFPGFNGVFWQGLFAPKGTPDAIVRRLSDALRVATTDPELRRRSAERGVTLQPGGADDLRRQLVAESDTWGRIIREADIKPE